MPFYRLSQQTNNNNNNSHNPSTNLHCATITLTLTLALTLTLTLTLPMFQYTGARLSKALPAKTLKLTLGVFMLCMVPAAQLRTFLKDERDERKHEKEQKTPQSASSSSSASASPSSSSSSSPSSASPPPPIHPYSPLYLSNIRCAMIGVGSGLLAGLFGVGGGAITVPAMALFTPLDFKTILGNNRV